MQKIIYALGAIAAILFAIMSGLFATGHQRSAIWLLCVGVFLSILAIAIHWFDPGQSALPLTPTKVEPEAQIPTSASRATREPVGVDLDLPPLPWEVDSFEPDEKDKEILGYLYRHDVTRILNYIAGAVDLDPTETRYRLSRLSRHRFVQLPGRTRVGRFPEYHLYDKGVEYVLKMNGKL
ncbi:MAG: hypothetical protein QOF72_2681 [Blastocatellia bacterium]|jgi:hypothetical protein|nr:hypothetical protein [Blastocatellia bacterium]